MGHETVNTKVARLTRSAIAGIAALGGGAAGAASGSYVGHTEGKKKGVRTGFRVGHRVGYVRGARAEHAYQKSKQASENPFMGGFLEELKQAGFQDVAPKHLHKFKANKKNPPGPAGGPGVAVKK